MEWGKVTHDDISRRHNLSIKKKQSGQISNQEGLQWPSGDEEEPPPRQNEKGDNTSRHQAEDISGDIPLSLDAEDDDKPMSFLGSPSSMVYRVCDVKVGWWGSVMMVFKIILKFPTVTPRQLPHLPRSEYATMGSQPLDLVRECLIYESPRSINCTEKFEPVYVFDTRGLPNNCYAYNSLWGKTDGARTIKTKSLVIFELKSEGTQRNQFYTGTPFALQISLHSPYSLVNPFLNGFSLKPCSNYYVFPSKQVNDLLPPPYTSGCYNYTSNWYARSGKGPRNKRSISLFSYIGGYLGLWLGISLVAICDAIETILLIAQWLWQKIVKKRKAKNKVHFKHAYSSYDMQRHMWIL
ncbi:hypothetical protein AVEN_99446-1 [Araneus ventricosus]|uniref:Uncharacterized protein n=1 Tax=Araneus ventricosus TaxID=182803 RepID=A0A4Y2J114_ARAVE|nr:hypothetical protein AVEN_99446-1 [Araneus ventricosus]